MSTQTQHTSSTIVKAAAAACIVGALAQVGGGILETLDRVLPADPGYALRTTLIAAAYLLLLGGVIGLARSGAAGNGWPARIGLAAAGLGWLTWAAAQLVLQIDFTLAETVLFPVGSILIGLGMILAGVAVLRARRWRGWQRGVPLLCGLYLVPLTMVLFAILGGPNFLVLAGYGLCWLALGVGLWTTPNTGARPTVVSGATSKKAAR